MKTHISINSKSIDYDFIVIQILSMSDPALSDIDLNKMAWVWTTLNPENSHMETIAILNYFSQIRYFSNFENYHGIGNWTYPDSDKILNVYGILNWNKPKIDKVEVILGHLKVAYGRFWIIFSIFSIFSILGYFSFYFAFYHNLAKFW